MFIQDITASFSRVLKLTICVLKVRIGFCYEIAYFLAELRPGADPKGGHGAMPPPQTMDEK